MAQFSLPPALFSILAAVALFFSSVLSQPPLNPAEQESVYRILDAVNSDIPWRTLFPDDLCTSAPHGVVCDYFSDDTTAAAATSTPHVTELSFGFVSDYSPNPPCNSISTFDPSVLVPLSYLKKLFFYKCFTQSKTPFPDFSSLESSRYYSSSLEELVFIENPALVGALHGKISNLKRLRRLVLTGSSLSGSFSDELGELVNLEQLTLSSNKLKGEISMDIFQNMKKLKVLDLSDNGLEGNVPKSIGYSTELLKIDLSYNRFSGKIPETFKGLKNIEFLDLSYNRFGKFGLPLVLAEMPSLKEVYLSGNFLGGEIPDIWGNLGGIMGIGLSGVGLVGNIPKSMGIHLRNACYIGLDNNMLEGVVPEEFGELEFVSELNLEKNNLSGRLPFSQGFLSKLGGKLKLEGNLDLCVDEGLKSAKVSLGLGQLKVCTHSDVSKTTLFYENSSPMLNASCLALMGICIGFLSLVLAEFVG